MKDLLARFYMIDTKLMDQGDKLIKVNEELKEEVSRVPFRKLIDVLSDLHKTISFAVSRLRQFN